jgi:hypothetical protein
MLKETRLRKACAYIPRRSFHSHGHSVQLQQPNEVGLNSNEACDEIHAEWTSSAGKLPAELVRRFNYCF